MRPDWQFKHKTEERIGRIYIVQSFFSSVLAQVCLTNDITNKANLDIGAVIDPFCVHASQNQTSSCYLHLALSFPYTFQIHQEVWCADSSFGTYSTWSVLRCTDGCMYARGDSCWGHRLFLILYAPHGQCQNTNFLETNEKWQKEGTQESRCNMMHSTEGHTNRTETKHVQNTVWNVWKLQRTNANREKTHVQALNRRTRPAGPNECKLSVSRWASLTHSKTSVVQACVTRSAAASVNVKLTFHDMFSAKHSSRWRNRIKRQNNRIELDILALGRGH